jgi:hypothetical protein
MKLTIPLQFLQRGLADRGAGSGPNRDGRIARETKEHGYYRDAV